MLKYYTGDTTAFTFTLTDDAGVAYAVSLSATVKATLRLERNGTASSVAGPWTCSSGATGASWSTGVVVATIAGADTTTVTPGVYKLELQIDLSGKTTVVGRQSIQVLKDTIS